MEEFDTYMQDQFPMRETFRTINAMTRRAWGQRDHNGNYYVGGHLSQLEFPLNADAVRSNASWLNTMSNNLFTPDMNVFYAIIPDKNYFLAPRYGFLHLDYAEMLRIIHGQLRQHTYIDLFDVMSLDDFYRTDIHWRQEAIFPVAQRLVQSMGVQMPSRDIFTSNTLFPFYGSFHGHAALPVRPDNLVYYSNRYIDAAVVHTLIEENRELVMSQYVNLDGERVRLGVNNPRMFYNLDSYDLFLAGAQAIMTIDVPNASTDRELIIFRDSFGSSIAPLLVGTYSRITLVDIRYVQSRMLDRFIDFEDQDVLFLFSTPILNRSGLFMR